MAQGRITSTSPLMVRVDGAETDSVALALAGYSPAQGDRVEVAPFAGQVLVRGKAS